MYCILILEINLCYFSLCTENECGNLKMPNTPPAVKKLVVWTTKNACGFCLSFTLLHFFDTVLVHFNAILTSFKQHLSLKQIKI